MRSSRILTLSLVLIIGVFLAACGGGGGSKNNNNNNQPLVITSTVLPQATINVEYSFVFQATGGSGTYVWAISGGTTPPGMTFNGNEALLSGTATAAGTYKFTVKVTDTPGDTATLDETLVVGGAVGVQCTSCATGSLTLPSGTPGVPYTANFTAVGGIAPYTWCIQEPNNGPCDNGAGILPAGLTVNASTGTISGTPTMATTAPVIFIIQASDSETPTSVGTAEITLTIFGVTTMSLPAGEIYVPYGNQQLTVSGGTAPYSWCVMESNGTCDNGSGGALPPGITLSPTCTSNRQNICTVSGTPTAAGAYNPTIQVTDSETPPAVTTASFSIDIAGIGNSALKGNYVFSFTGYNNGTPVIMAGAFAADGTGNITSGELDLNNGTGEVNGQCAGSHNSPQQQTIMAAPSSTYSIGAAGTGLGTMTLVTSAGTYNFTISIRADGSGNLIQDNADPNTRGSGVIKVQTTGVGIGNLQANFALGQFGSDPGGNRYVAAGQITVEDNQGDFTGPVLDVNDNGTGSSHVFAGTLSVDIDSFGRGCFANMSFDHNLNNIYYYAYYIVSADELVILSTDPLGGTKSANLTLWSLERQLVGATGFNNAALASSNVAALSARDTNGASDVSLGLFVGQGSSTHTCQNMQFDNATFTFDENQGGTLHQQQSTSGQYCVDSTTGRVTLQNFTGAWSAHPPVFYLGGSDPGFVVGTDPVSTAGTIEPQAGSSFTDTTVTGGYWGGSVAPAIPTITDSVTSLYADGNGNMAGTQYTSAPSGPGGPTHLAYTYSVASSGRGVVQNNGQTAGILYVVAESSFQYQSKFILLPAGNKPALSVFLGLPRQ